MQNLNVEIHDFLNSSNFSTNTLNHYKRRLLEFSRELEDVTDTPPEQLHLQRIYEVYDESNLFITYNPIDVQLVNDYFSSRLNRGYYCFKDNKDALGSFFNYLNRNYDFPNLVKEMTITVNKYGHQKNKVDILSRHDILKFFHYTVFNSTNRNRDILLFILFITTGCRPSEIVNIKIQDISWEENIIYLPKTKHNKSKYIPLRPGLSDSIKVFCKKYNLQNHDSLFDLNQTQMRKLFYELLEKANLPKVKLYSLRHSFATMMYESGTTITEVQQLLGHVDVFTTQGYVHPNLVRNSKIKIKENEKTFDTISKLLKRR